MGRTHRTHVGEYANTACSVGRFIGTAVGEGVSGQEVMESGHMAVGTDSRGDLEIPEQLESVIERANPEYGRRWESTRPVPFSILRPRRNGALGIW